MIHLVGVGCIGLLHGSHLVRHSSVTFLSRRSCVGMLEVSTNSLDCKTRFPITVEQIGDNKTPINRLIVTTKAYDTEEAIKSLLPRLQLAKNPCILLLQNGVLQSRNLLMQNSILSPRDGFTPTVLLGLTTHGVSRLPGSALGIIHAGVGQTKLGHDLDAVPTRQSQEFENTLTEAWKVLNSHKLEPQELFREITLKVAINACLNPVVAALNAKNGVVADRHASQLVKSICDEIAPIIASTIQSMTSAELYEQVQDVAFKTRLNDNSMAVDVSLKRQTEIDFINGYFIELGARLGLSTQLNTFITNLIKALTS